MEELSQQREELVREAEGASHRHAAEVRDLQARKDDATARLQVRASETKRAGREEEKKKGLIVLTRFAGGCGAVPAG